MSVSECLVEVQEWERADTVRRQTLARKVESERAVGDAEIQRVGAEAAAVLASSGVAVELAISTAVSQVTNGITARTVVAGPAGWTLPGSGFGVTTEGRLMQVWVCCAGAPNSYTWQPARCWQRTDPSEPGRGVPKLALWQHHDCVCLDDKHDFQPLEEVVALGIHRLLSRQAEAPAALPKRPAARVLASSLAG